MYYYYYCPRCADTSRMAIPRLRETASWLSSRNTERQPQCFTGGEGEIKVFVPFHHQTINHLPTRFSGIALHWQPPKLRVKKQYIGKIQTQNKHEEWTQQEWKTLTCNFVSCSSCLVEAILKWCLHRGGPKKTDHVREVAWISYTLVQKKRSCFAKHQPGRTFSQLSDLSFAQPCMFC